MCLGVPGRVLSLEDGDQIASVDVLGVPRRVNVGMRADTHLQPGQWVVIQAGYALETISEAEALAARTDLDMSALFAAAVDSMPTEESEHGRLAQGQRGT